MRELGVVHEASVHGHDQYLKRFGSFEKEAPVEDHGRVFVRLVAFCACKKPRVTPKRDQGKQVAKFLAILSDAGHVICVLVFENVVLMTQVVHENLTGIFGIACALFFLLYFVVDEQWQVVFLFLRLNTRLSICNFIDMACFSCKG